jgi:hypothetical protein
VYVLVRVDIPLADQIVQAGHACLEAGFKYDRPDRIIHLVLLQVGSERQLRERLSRLDAAGIGYVPFHEPDDGMGCTAACTEPLAGLYRRVFHGMRLWEPAGNTARV